MRFAGSHIAFDVAVARDVRVPMRDGLTMAADVYRPADDDGRPADGPFPTIVERTPYDRTRVFQHRCGHFFASRGYNWVVIDSRGRGASDGEFHFYNRHHEGLDGFDAIEWLAAQPWSNGKIATTGLSQAGANQQAAAVMRPPHLATQFLNDCGINYWRRTVRNNGAFAEGIFAPYAFRMAITGKEAAADPSIKRALKEFLADTPKWIRKMPLRPGATPLALAPSYERWYFEMAHIGDYTDFYRTPMTSIQEYMDDYPDIPLCFTASWYGNRHAWANLEKFRLLRQKNKNPVKLVIGPWIHQDDFMEQRVAGNVNFGNDAFVALNDARLRWFDRHLKGLDTGIDTDADLRIFVMGGGPGTRDALDLLEHGGAWASHAEWPPAGSREQVLFLHGDGTLDAAEPPAGAAPLEYVFDPKDPVPTIGGGLQNPWGVTGLVNGGGYDQRGQPGFALADGKAALASRADTLVFRTEPLSTDLEVTGDVTVHLWIRSSAPDTDFTAKLVDEYPPSPDYPNGYALNLVDDITRLSYRDGRLTRELATPGTLYRIAVGPMPISNLFRAGHRLRLDVSSSSFPQFEVNPNTGAPADRVRGSAPALNAVFVDADHPSTVTFHAVERC